MMKYLLIFLISLELYASIIPFETKQLLLVSSSDFNTSVANMQAFERSDEKWEKVFDPIQVNLGRTGLAWGKGLVSFTHQKEEPLKKEGDGKSPAGLFSLDFFFGYEPANFRFPYLKVDEQTLCIDDIHSPYYNQILEQTNPLAFKSFEYMKRDDEQYKLGISVGHNKSNQQMQGSCIFIHIQREQKSPTAGCTSLREKDLLYIMQWLDKDKHPLLLQLPQIYLDKEFK